MGGSRHEARRLHLARGRWEGAQLTHVALCGYRESSTQSASANLMTDFRAYANALERAAAAEDVAEIDVTEHGIDAFVYTLPAARRLRRAARKLGIRIVTFGLSNRCSS
jgi:hypothetical protein